MTVLISRRVTGGTDFPTAFVRALVSCGMSNGGDDLVDAAVEGEGPALVGDAAGDGDLEGGGGASASDLAAQFVVPVRAELGAPDALRTAAAVVRGRG
jgi:hypothetical protein